MVKNSFKITISALLCMAFCSISNVVFAQVFSPRAGNVQSATASTATGVKAQEVNSANSKSSASQKAGEENVTAKVKKNFSVSEEEEKYDNTIPKIVSFKIVNGEVVIDKDKERSILVYYDNYQVHRGLDEYVRCSVRIYVLNDLVEKISSLGLKIYWPEISTSVQMNQLNPGVSTYKDIMLMGDGCFTMDKVPTIEVNRCRVKGMSQDKCADAVRWYEKPQS